MSPLGTERDISVGEAWHPPKPEPSNTPSRPSKTRCRPGAEPINALPSGHHQDRKTTLFPWLEDELGPLTEKQQQLVQTLEIIRIEDQLPPRFQVPGRPAKDRAAIARAFVAKAVYDMPTTRGLLDRLATDVSLRRICGWEQKSAVPSESVCSRAFAEFAATAVPQHVHDAVVRTTFEAVLLIAAHLMGPAKAPGLIQGRDKGRRDHRAHPGRRREPLHHRVGRRVGDQGASRVGIQTVIVSYTFEGASTASDG